MARVIKGGQGGPAVRRSANLGMSADRKVIEKEVYKARQQAAAILAQAEEERDRLLAEGQKTAAQAREEAATDGAEEAFAEAAVEALAAFRLRAERFGEARDDIQVLAIEVAKKILGGKFKLSEGDIGDVVDAGMRELRGRRKLRVQVPSARARALLRERPLLMRAMKTEPDLIIEGVDDVSPGFARVVTEVGGALCSEQAALDALAESVDVEETAVAPEKQSALHAITNAGLAPSGLGGALQSADKSAFDEDSYEMSEDALYAEDPSDESDEHTAFIPDAHRRAKNVGANNFVSDEPSTESTQVGPRPRRASERRKRRKEPAAESESGRSARRARERAREASQDTDATQALDVSDLRRDLNASSELDDDLDLFADDAVE